MTRDVLQKHTHLGSKPGRQCSSIHNGSDNDKAISTLKNSVEEIERDKDEGSQKKMELISLWLGYDIMLNVNCSSWNNASS